MRRPGLAGESNAAMHPNLLAAAIVALVTSEVARTLTSPGARRLCAHELRLGAGAVAVGVAGLAGAAWALLASPASALTIAGLAAFGWGVAWLRARERAGARRGWPPGSLSLRDSFAALVERDFLHRRARRLGPVFKMAQFHHPVVCVVGLARGRELLRRHAGALAPPPLPLSAEIPRGFLRYMRPEDHERYSKLFRAAFSERTLAGNRGAATDEARRFLAALVRRGAARPEPDEFLLPTLCRIFFGTLLEPADLEVVRQCGRDATFSTATGRPTAKARAALARFVELLGARRDRGHDSAGEASVWAELAAREPSSLADPTVLGNLFLLLEASRDSIGGLLLWSLQRLGEHPEWVGRLRESLDAPEMPGPPSDASRDPFLAFTLETLRLAQSEYVYRRALAPIAVDGFTIPRGWLVRICVAESHRLDPPFADPDRFDPDRHRARRFGPDELAPFGLDRHACLGARLTTFLARIFLAELARGYEIALVAAGPPERAPRHWVHWAPSRRLRIVVSQRVPGTADPDSLGA